MLKEKDILRLDWSEMPRINGMICEDIYIKRSNGRYAIVNGVDCYTFDIEYYECINYFRNNPKEYSLKFKELPKEFMQFLGHQIIKGKPMFVESINFHRYDPNYSRLISFHGVDRGGCDTGYTIYQSDLENNPKLLNKVMSLINAKFELEALPWYYGVVFDSTELLTVDGLNYAKPHFSNSSSCSVVSFGYPMNIHKNIRVYNPSNGLHYYLTKPDKYEENETYLRFTYKSSDKYQRFGTFLQNSNCNDPMKIRISKFRTDGYVELYNEDRNHELGGVYHPSDLWKVVKVR